MSTVEIWVIAIRILDFLTSAVKTIGPLRSSSIIVGVYYADEVFVVSAGGGASTKYLPLSTAPAGGVGLGVPDVS